jgi:hypothetical protein
MMMMISVMRIIFTAVAILVERFCTHVYNYKYIVIKTMMNNFMYSKYQCVPREAKSNAIVSMKGIMMMVFE